MVTSEIFGLKIPGQFKMKNGVSHYYGHYNEVLDWLEKRPRVQHRLQETNSNAKSFDHHLYEGDDDFKGGSFDQLIEPHSDFSFYHDMMKEISDNKLWKSIIHRFDKQMVRRRSRSEHDGEWDYDKRFDVQPFQRREKKKEVVRNVKLVMEGSFSCGVSAETLNRYGSFVSAVISLLEKNGVLVEVYTCYTTDHVSQSGKNAKSLFKIKKADEYLPVSQILKAMSAVWYRRVVFGLIVSHAELHKEHHDYGLGRPHQWGKVWEVKNKTLHIYSVPSFEDQHSIIQKLCEVIGVEQGEVT